MPIFEDADQLYQQFAALIDRLNDQPALARRLARLQPVIRFDLTDPVAQVTLDAHHVPLAAHVGESELTPTLRIAVPADAFHQFWLGRLSLRRLLAQGQAEGDLTPLERVKSRMPEVFHLYTEVVEGIEAAPPTTPAEPPDTDAMPGVTDIQAIPGEPPQALPPPVEVVETEAVDQPTEAEMPVETVEAPAEPRQTLETPAVATEHAEAPVEPSAQQEARAEEAFEPIGLDEAQADSSAAAAPMEAHRRAQRSEPAPKGTPDHPAEPGEARDAPAETQARVSAPSATFETSAEATLSREAPAERIEPVGAMPVTQPTETAVGKAEAPAVETAAPGAEGEAPAPPAEPSLAPGEQLLVMLATALWRSRTAAPAPTAEPRPTPRPNLDALNRRLIPLVEGEVPRPTVRRLNQALPSEETPLRLEMLRRMTLIRAVETRLTDDLKARRLPASELITSTGLEGIAVGACFALRPEDYVVTSQHSVGELLARGSDPTAVLAEIYGKGNGLCGGKSGPISLADARVGGLAAGLTGASTVLAAGWGLAARLQGTDQVTLCFLDDEAANQGMFYEALNFAAVRSLPIVFVLVNDGPGQERAASDGNRLDGLAQRAVPFGIGSLTVDGSDVWAVYRSVRAAVRVARTTSRPTLIEARIDPTGGGDPQASDPLVKLYQALVDGKVLTPADAREIATAAQLQVERAAERADGSPAPSPDALTTHVYSPDSAALYRRARHLPSDRELTYFGALNEALAGALATDPSTYLIGPELATGGRFGTAAGLLDRFGPTRVVDAPPSPSAIIGSSVTAAAAGLRPIVDLGWGAFLALAAEPILNYVAQLRYTSGGQYRAPLVIRVAGGPDQGWGPQAASSLERWLAGVPGLLVAIPSTPYDAKGLLTAAIRSENPVLVFEPKALYPLSGPVPTASYIVPLGIADIKRRGDDCTIVAIGPALHEALAAAETLAREGIRAEVIDPRTLMPFDWSTVLGSAARTGRLIIVEEVPLGLDWGAEIAANAASHISGALRAPIQRLAAAPVPLPYAPNLARAALVGADDIAAAARRAVRGT